MSAPAIRTPRDLPAVRLWLLDQWRPGGPFWIVGARAMIDSLGEVNLPAEYAQAILDMDPDERAFGYARAELSMLGGANLWYVTAEMCDLLEAAIPKVPDDVRIPDLPDGIEHPGFVVFERPLDCTAREGQPIRVDAVLWGLAHIVDEKGRHWNLGARPMPEKFRDREWLDTYGEGGAIVCSSYQRFNLDDGLNADDLGRHAGALTQLLAHDQIDSDLPRPMQEGMSFMVHGDFWSPLGRSDWPVAESIEDARGVYTQASSAESAIEDRKILAALWTLVNQSTIATATTERPARPVVRRVQRAGLPKSAADVRVVTLRKIADGHERDPERVGTGRKLDHRVIVGADTGGFWRNQPYGPNSSLRKLIWIDPFARGPEDAPLRVPETVRLWKR